jgi:hypothetical protein
MRNINAWILFALLLATCAFTVPVTAEEWDTPPLNDSELREMGVVNGSPNWAGMRDLSQFSRYEPQVEVTPPSRETLKKMYPNIIFFNSSDLPMHDRSSSGQVSFNPDGSFTVIRTESDERGATAAEPTQTLPPAPGGDPLMELRGAHPNIERSAEIMEYIRTCGLSNWYESPYNTTCRYVYLVPGTSCSQTLVYLNRDVNEREDHTSIVWVGLVDRGEELPVEASDPLASLSVRYPQVMENPAVDAFVREDRPERWGEVFENETTVQVYLIAENVTFRELIATVESGAVTGVTVLDEQHLAVNKTRALAVAGVDVSPAAQLIDIHLQLKDGRVVWMVSYMDGPVYTSIPVDAGEAPAPGEKVPGFSTATAAGALLVPAAALHWRRR